MTFLPPWRRIQCPYCFTAVALGQCDIVSSQPGRELLRAAPTAGWRRRLGRVWASSLDGEQAVRELAAWRCPHCGEPLPPNSHRAEMVVIGLIGGGGAGKTHYLTGLIERLQHAADLQGVGCVRFSPLNQETVDVYQHQYYDLLFRNRHRLGATATIAPGNLNRPLIYTLLFPRRRGRRSREVNLVLYDGSGEQLVRQHDMVQLHPYVLHASGLILLVDPVAMPGVGANLPSYLRQGANDPDAPAQLLQSILTLYPTQRGLPADRPLSIPLAVTIAKADLLRYIPRTISLPQSIREDSNYLGGYDAAEALAVSQEAQELFRRLGDAEVWRLAGRFARRSFHAVSATGGPATSPDGRFPNITPTRCLDPLFWLLWRLGVIAAAPRAKARR